MSQINMGNLFIEMGYGAKASGRSGQAWRTISSESFRESLNEVETSFKRVKDSSQIKNTSSKEESKSYAKKYPKSNEMDTGRNQKIDQHKVDSQPKEKVQIEEDIEVEEKDTAEESANENQLLILISQGLHLSIDEIQETLEKLDLEIKDLKSQEGFSTFISEIYGQGSVAELLTGLEDLKSITTLFEQLTSLEEASEDNLQDSVGKMQMALSQQMVVQSEEVSGSSKEVLKDMDNTPIKEMDFVQSEEEATEFNRTMLDSQEENSNQNLFQGQQNEEMGMSIPINHFTTTSIQKFETDVGVVTQTTTKATLSGATIMEQIDFKVLGQTKEISLQLSPKELGDLNIKIIENNSALVAEIKVDNDKAKELILSQIHQLKESLENQGLTITDMKVDIRQSNQKSQMEQGRQKSSKRIQEIISKQMGEMEEEETPSMQMTSEIDYMV